MNKYRYSIITFIIFVLPSFLYLVVNFYWWLFDGNIINGDKFAGAFMGVLLGTIVVLLANFADEEAQQ